MNDSSAMPTLPADIPGLRDEGAPITVNGLDGVIIDPDASMDDGSDAVLWVAHLGAGTIYCDPVTAVQVRLSARSGRALAAWWVNEMCWSGRCAGFADDVEAVAAIATAERGQPMEPAQIETLRTLVLRLAGRS